MTPNQIKEARQIIDNPEDSANPKKFNYCPACGDRLSWKDYFVEDKSIIFVNC